MPIQIKPRTNAAVPLLFLLAIWVTPWVAVAQSEVRRVPLFESPRVLTGWKAVATTWVEVPAHAREVRLVVGVTPSDLLALDRSTITVRADELPLLSRRLEDVSGQLEIRLPAGAGFRRIDVVSKPVIHDDECLSNHREDAWIRIGDPGHLELELDDVAPPEPNSATSPALSSLLDDWEGEPVIAVEARGDATGWHGALIAADHWLRALGKSASHEPSFVPSVVVRPHDTPPNVLALLVRDDDDLNVLAPDEGTARRALQLLSTAELDHCFQATCPVFDGRNDSLTTVTERSLTVFERPQPWTTSADVGGALAFAWEPPPDWTLLPMPTLRFDVAHDDTIPVTRPGSVHVSVNGVPVASFPLDAGHGSFAANIPEALWQVRRWEVAVQPRVFPDLRACERYEDGTGWVTVSSVRLEVPRRERESVGVAELIQRGVSHVEGPSELLGRHRAAVATVLSNVRAFPDVTNNPACMNCLRVRRFPKAGITQIDGGRWYDPDDERAVLGIDPQNSYVLTRIGDALTLYVPTDASEPTPPPRALLGSSTLTWAGGTWRALRPPVRSGTYTVGRAHAVEPHADPLEARRLRTFHFVWLMFVVLSTLGAVSWAWRSVRRFKRRGSDIEVRK